MSDQPEIRLYSVQGIVIGTVIGSLAAGVFMMVLNCVALGAPATARKVAITGFTFFALLIAATVLFPVQSLGVTLAMTIVQALVAYVFAEKVLGENLRYHADQTPACMHSPFRAAGVGIVTAVLMFSLLMILTILADSLGLLPQDLGASD